MSTPRTQRARSTSSRGTTRQVIDELRAMQQAMRGLANKIQGLERLQEKLALLYIKHDLVRVVGQEVRRG